MSISENKAPTHVFCPLADQMIEAIDCIENRDTVDGMISPEHMPVRFTRKSDWEEICRACRWHDYN